MYNIVNIEPLFYGPIKDTSFLATPLIYTFLKIAAMAGKRGCFRPSSDEKMPFPLHRRLSTVQP